MTSVPLPVLTVRSYRSVSWWTITAVTASGWSLPVLVSAARTLFPAFNWLMGTVLPLASRTRVPAVNEFPPQDVAGGSSAGALASPAALSARVPLSPAPPDRPSRDEDAFPSSAPATLPSPFPAAPNARPSAAPVSVALPRPDQENLPDCAALIP